MPKPRPRPGLYHGTRSSWAVSGSNQRLRCRPITTLDRITRARAFRRRAQPLAPFAGCPAAGPGPAAAAIPRAGALRWIGGQELRGSGHRVGPLVLRPPSTGFAYCASETDADVFPAEVVVKAHRTNVR